MPCWWLTLPPPNPFSTIQLFRRLARAFKRTSLPVSNEQVPPPFSSKISRAERSLHKHSASCTPDWLCAPIVADVSVPLRTPALSPSVSSSATSTTYGRSPTSATWKKGTFGRAADGTRRRLSKSPSQVALHRNDSVLSFASADAFGQSNLFDDDEAEAYLSPRSATHYSSTMSPSRRTRSNTDASNYSLPSSFNYQPSGFPTHRPKNSQSSTYTDDTVESEVLMTCQMVESAYQAVRSRPASLIKARRSFSDERSAYGRQPVWI